MLNSNVCILERLVHGRSGPLKHRAEFPSGTKKIYWEAHNIWAYLPFTVSKYLLYILFFTYVITTTGNTDANWVHHINKRSIQNGHHVVEIKYISFLGPHTEQLSSSIRTACGNGKAVVVRHANPNRINATFDVNFIKRT